MKILETLRDALQGLIPFVNTEDKIKIARNLLDVGFDYLDVGSFVSERVVPQMKDTAQIINALNTDTSKTELSVLVVNEKGAERAAAFSEIDMLIYPFSTSPEFLKRNLNTNLEGASEIIYDIQNVCQKYNKKLLLYFSMAFGNPYGDPDHPDLIYQWTEKFLSWEIYKMSFSDITGVGRPEKISEIFNFLMQKLPEIESGLHLHVKSHDWEPKVKAAFENGCKIFDGVISGLGGCPMTGYELLGNLPTANLVDFANRNDVQLSLDEAKFREAIFKINQILVPYIK